MITQEEINGRKASVQWLNDDFEPVDNQDDATIIRVLFDDGETMWMVPDNGEEDSENEEIEESEAEDQMVTAPNSGAPPAARVRRAEDQVPLDPDLLKMAEGKPQHIIQQIYDLQEQRNNSRYQWNSPRFE